MSKSAAEILAEHQVIAVVGMSTMPEKSAHAVPLQLILHGWTVIPVHPWAESIAGRRAYRRLADIPVPVGLVDVFRPSEQAADIVRQAIAIGASAVWLQQGIVSAEGRRLAEAAGIDYVEDACTAVIRAVYQLRPPHPQPDAARCEATGSR